MILSTILTYLTTGIKYLIPAFTLYLIILSIYNRFFHPLSKFPGPIIASITPLWYFYSVRYGVGKNTQYPLHERYGPVVRVTPNSLAVCDAKAIEYIYGVKTGKVFKKGNFYTGFDPHISFRTDGFSERDDKKHSERRRIVAPLYTQGSVLQYEPCVDRIIDLFYTTMEKFARSGEVFDMSLWIKRYTFDVIGEIYYGMAGGFGMIREDRDFNDWIYLFESSMPNIGASNTYVPYGMQTLFFASQMIKSKTRRGLMGAFDIPKQAKLAVQKRQAERSQRAGEKSNDQEKQGHAGRKDMLDKLLDLVQPDQSDMKSFWTPEDAATEAWAIVWAGSDTTAIALTSIFYYLHQNPSALQKLQAEIDEAFESGRLTHPVRYDDGHKLPYLHAVVMEGMRVHPSLGTGLPRVVPDEGFTLPESGMYIPGGGGIEVVMNSCSVHFDKIVFGEDSKEWRPERWLLKNEHSALGGTCESEEKLKELERGMLQFGYGTRVCIGRHITGTEMYKLLPTVLRDFTFEFVGGKELDSGERAKEWTIFQGWFHWQKDVWVRVKSRRGDRVRPKLVE